MNAGEAEFLLSNETLNEIFDNIERNALEWAIGANVSDDETRRAALGEVRAIRSVRGKLKVLLTAKANPGPGAVV